MYHIACEQGGRRGDEDTAASVNVKTVLVPTPAVDLQGSERYFYPLRYANPSRSGKSTSKTAKRPAPDSSALPKHWTATLSQ